MKPSKEKMEVILKNKKKKNGNSKVHLSDLYCRHGLLNCMVCSQLKELGLYK